MIDNLSRKEVTREIWNGFDVCLEYRVGLGWKIWKNGRKIHIWAFFGDMYWYTLNMYRYSLGSDHFGPTCTGIGQRCTGTCNALFSISTSFCILAITCSLLIRFE